MNVPENLWKAHTNSGWEALNTCNHAEAERHLRNAWQVSQRFGLYDDHHIISLRNLGWLYAHIGKHSLAEELSRQRIPLAERVPGRKGRNLREALCDHACALRDQGKFLAARTTFTRAVAVSEQYLGVMDLNLTHLLHELALIEQALRNYGAAKKLYHRELIILEQTQGAGHPSLVDPLQSYAAVCQLQGREYEATAMLSRSRKLGKS